MGKRDPRVDAYIAKAAPFAQPILAEIRERVHEGFPEISEAIKWGAPAFEHHGLVANMAAFKAHCAFGFWNRALQIPDKKGAMGQFGCIRSAADLPADAVLVGYVREAARLNEIGKPAVPRLLTRFNDIKASTPEGVAQLTQIDALLRDMSGRAFGFSPAQNTVLASAADNEQARTSALKQWYAWWYYYHDKPLDVAFDKEEDLFDPAKAKKPSPEKKPSPDK